MQDFQLRMKEHMGEMAQAAQDRESRERIAEIQGRVQLLLKGIEALGQVAADSVNSELGQSRTAQ